MCRHNWWIISCSVIYSKPEVLIDTGWTNRFECCPDTWLDTKVLDVKERFPTNETLAEVTAWRVPPSERYPEGVRYSMQYGGTDGETIIRYDNFPNHPRASHHHKHIEDGSVENVEFPGLAPLFREFKQEVRNHGEHWS